jgi:8-amino-7-oxononanoate synthase
MGILSVPLSDGWEQRPFLTHIIPIWTRPRYAYWLVFHLSLSKFSAFPVEYPTVPKGTNRVRVTLHADNTQTQIEGLVSAICDWAQEMIHIESNKSGDSIPRAARQVYAWMADENVGGVAAFPIRTVALSEPSLDPMTPHL